MKRISFWAPFILSFTVSQYSSAQVGQKVLSRTNDKGDLVDYYASPQYWSGHGTAFSEWYSVSTPPTPSGYYLFSQRFSLQGDRGCVGGDEVHDAQTIKIKVLPMGEQPVFNVPSRHHIMPDGTPGYGEWAVCRLVKRSDGGVEWQFALQGHNERKSLHIEDFRCCDNGVSMNFRVEGDAATSAGLIEVIYRKGKTTAP